MDPDAPLGKGARRLRSTNDPERIRCQITVSIRLGKTVFVADGSEPKAGNSPTREKPEDVSCICSLDDVNMSRSLDRTAERIAHTLGNPIRTALDDFMEDP